jgi:hypothetical protein
MSVRQIRFLFRLSAGLLLALSAALVTWAIVAPVQLPDTSTATPRQAAHEPIVNEVAGNGPNESEAVFERQFRRPLFDPPPKTPEPVVEKPPTPPPVRLVATMPEPGGGHAMLADMKGAISVRRVGQEMIAGGSSVVIKEVASDKVVLLFENRLVTLTLSSN